MHRSRSLLAIMLMAALLLPHSAAMLCAVFNPMSMGVASQADSGHAVADADAPTSHCDFSECSTAVVAPIPTLAAAANQLPSAEMGSAQPSVPLLKAAIPPLTPPPIA